MKKDDIMSAIDVVNTVAKSKSVQKWLFGTYADGKPRSMADCMKNEILSPKERKKLEKKYKKKKKHKKKITF